MNTMSPLSQRTRVAAVISVLVLCLLVSTEAAQAPRWRFDFPVPSQCLNNADGKCCPANDAEGISAQACGAPQRGECTLLASLPNINQPACTYWQTGFTHGCVCKGNFAGAACGKCKHGWTGTNCDQPLRRVRRDIATYTDEEFAELRNQLRTLKGIADDRYVPNNNFDPGQVRELMAYDYFPWLHSTATQPTDSFNGLPGNSGGFAHMGPAFFTWHREFLLRFEEAMAEAIGKPFALPYFNWTMPANTSSRIFEQLGGNGTDATFVLDLETNFTGSGGYLDPTSTFYSFQPVDVHGLPLSEPHIRRCIGCSDEINGFSSTPPSLSAVNYILEATEYDRHPWNTTTDCGGSLSGVGPDSSCLRPKTHSLRNALEGWACGPVGVRSTPFSPDRCRDGHNRFHMYIGGIMSTVPDAPNDILFWFHHAFVDLLGEIWMRKNPDQVQRGFLPDSLAPVGHNRDDCMGPFFPYITNADVFKPSCALGYTYEGILEDPTGACAPLPTSPSVTPAEECSKAGWIAFGVLLGVLVLVGVAGVIRCKVVRNGDAIAIPHNYQSAN